MECGVTFNSNLKKFFLRPYQFRWSTNIHILEVATEPSLFIPLHTSVLSVLKTYGISLITFLTWLIVTKNKRDYDIRFTRFGDHNELSNFPAFHIIPILHTVTKNSQPFQPWVLHMVCNTVSPTMSDAVMPVAARARRTTVRDILILPFPSACSTPSTPSLSVESRLRIFLEQAALEINFNNPGTEQFEGSSEFLIRS